MPSLDILNVTDEDPQKQQEQAQRVQRSVFVQELILSTLEKQFVDDLSKDKLDLGPD